MTKKIRITEDELVSIIQSSLDEQELESGIEGAGVETGTGDAGGTGARQWESGMSRGPGNPVGITHWADNYTLNRGKANPLDESTSTLKESRWYNTLLDFVGIVDPTGAVDLVNAISYFRQGDIIYALLSLISVVPYVGDLIAKPFIGIIKMNKNIIHGMNAAAKNGNAAKLMSEAKKVGPEATAFVKAVGGSRVGAFFTKILGGIEKLPFFKTFAKDIKRYRKVFVEAAELSAKGTKNIRIFRSGDILTRMQRKGLLNRTKLYMKFIGWLTGISGGALAVDAMSEGDLNKKFKQFLGSKEGEEAFDSMKTDDQEEVVNTMQGD
jgi:hypothetical protein